MQILKGFGIFFFHSQHTNMPLWSHVGLNLLPQVSFSIQPHTYADSLHNTPCPEEGGHSILKWGENVLIFCRYQLLLCWSVGYRDAFCQVLNSYHSCLSLLPVIVLSYAMLTITGCTVLKLTHVTFSKKANESKMLFIYIFLVVVLQE